MTAPDGTVFFLPGLGLSGEAAAPLAAALGDRFRVVGIDLPGQGGAPDAVDGTVSAPADAVVAVIETETRADGLPWLIVAHSMGGKVAAVVAERVLAGRANVFGLAGAVLLAPSPPTPEPMAGDKRSQMLSWAEDGALSVAAAREFIEQNLAQPLPAEAMQDAVDQVRQTSPVSWRRWLTDGSQEDVSGLVGALNLPVVVLAGEDDDDLGARAQPQLLADVYPRARFVALASTGHLLPYERPEEVAAEVVRLWESTVGASPRVPAEWSRVIASDRTPVESRALLAQRALVDDARYSPKALSPAQLETLRAVAGRLVPQPGAHAIDLAARVDADLAAGRGDGWRAAGLPGDTAAYRRGLDALAAIWPDSPHEQDALVARVISGDGSGGADWSGDELRLWFEDARTDLARAWLAHPASLARAGYDGFATSGPGPGPAGFGSLGAGLRDAWEPAELGTLDSTPTPATATGTPTTTDTPDEETAA